MQKIVRAIYLPADEKKKDSVWLTDAVYGYGADMSVRYVYIHVRTLRTYLRK
jgi:hypothetical protein